MTDLPTDEAQAPVGVRVATRDEVLRALYPEAAANFAHENYKRQSQANLDRAVAISEAGEDLHDEDAPSQPAADIPATEPASVPGALPVAEVRKVYADSPSPEAREYLAKWTTFDADVPKVQKAASDKRAAMGEQAWARMVEAFDAMSDREQLEVMWSLRLDADAPSAPSTTAKGKSMQTDDTGMPTDQELAAADAEVHKHFYNYNRTEAAAAQARRDALYARRFPGSIVGSQGRTI